MGNLLYEVRSRKVAEVKEESIECINCNFVFFRHPKMETRCEIHFNQSLRKWKWVSLLRGLFGTLRRIFLRQIREKWQRMHQLLEEKVQLSFNFHYLAQGFENLSAYIICIPNMRLIWENAYVYRTLHGTFLCEIYCSTIYIVHTLRSKVSLDLAYYSNCLRNSAHLSLSHTAEILQLLY
jgi:hypothetical protein